MRSFKSHSSKTAAQAAFDAERDTGPSSVSELHACESEEESEMLESEEESEEESTVHP